MTGKTEKGCSKAIFKSDCLQSFYLLFIFIFLFVYKSIYLNGEAFFFASR